MDQLEAPSLSQNLKTQIVPLQIANIQKHDAMPEIRPIIQVAGTVNGNHTSQSAW